MKSLITHLFKRSTTYKSLIKEKNVSYTVIINIILQTHNRGGEFKNYYLARNKNYKKTYDWQKENLDRIAFNVPKGQRDKIKEIAIQKGYKSTNDYIRELIYKDLKGMGV